MKKYSFRQFIAFLQAERLLPEEKDSVRARIAAEIRMRPVRDMKTMRPLRQRSAGFSFIQLTKSLFEKFIAKATFKTGHKRIQYMPIALILTLLASGSASYAANGSLPGDVLYPVKIYVNETVEGLLNTSDEAKARFHVRIAGERLEEAEKLAAEGALDANMRAEIEANLEKHINEVEERERRLEEQNKLNTAAEVNVELETSLRVHGNILGIIAGNEARVEANVAPIARKAEKEANKAAERRVKAEVKMSAEANGKEPAEGKMDAAERKLNEVRKFIESNRANMRAKVIADAKIKLNAAQDVFAEGKIKFETGLYSEAFALFQKAMRMAEEAKLAMKIHGEVETKVRLNSVIPAPANVREEKEKNRDEENEVQEEIESGDNATVNTEGEINANEEAESGSVRSNLRNLFRINLGR